VLKNTVKTFPLLAGLGGFMVLIGSLLGGTSGLVIGLLLGLVMVGGSYWMSDKLAVRSARAREVQPGELDWLRADLEALAARGKMRTPRLLISPDMQPNAFATGRNEKTALVCVTQGLLHTLDRDEVFMVTEGVLVLQEGAPAAGPGDTVVVPAGQPIRLSNPGTTPATALVAISAGFTASAEDGNPIPTPPWAQ